MKKTTKIILIIAIIVIVVFWGISKFNGFVSGEEKVASQWGNVENVYQRRADLIPNLVSTVKGYAQHEQNTLENVIEARSKATSVNVNTDNLTEENIAAFQKAQDGLSSALSRLMVVVERYPDLKANQNFLDLQAQLEGTENRIATERRKYNDIAQEYNTSIRRFPANLIANIGGFEKKGYFTAKEGADIAPEVQF